MLSQFGALTLAQDTQFGGLPLDFVALVFLRLPLDARLRAREVSRGWCSLLSERRFWLVLDFSAGSGVVARFTRALLFAAGERGRGHLHTLDLIGVRGLSPEDLAQFVAAHGQSLRSVTAPESHPLSPERVPRLCRSAPLCTLRCYVGCSAAEALPLLRCEAPYALLHVIFLWVYGFDNNQQVLDFAAALTAHSGKIIELIVQDALGNVAVADALLRGIAEAGVSNMTFAAGCQLTPASLPGLTRLLEAGCLERLVIANNGQALFEVGPELTAFCHTLRSSGLQALKLHASWGDRAAADELLSALVGHQTLRELSLGGGYVANTDDAQRAASEQLASLITHSNALQKLNFQDHNRRVNNLGEAGLAPIFEALPHSSSLEELLVNVAEISCEFAHDVILPAVRANSSLRKLSFSYLSWVQLGPHSGPSTIPELAEAEAIVAARTQTIAAA